MMKEYLTIGGRFPRSVYWVGFGCVFGLFGLVGALQDLFKIPDDYLGPFLIALLPAVYVWVIIQIKRWHDLDKSGVWMLIALVPCAGTLIILILCGCTEGTRGPNRYGPDPLGRPPSPPPLPPMQRP